MSCLCRRLKSLNSVSLRWLGSGKEVGEMEGCVVFVLILINYACQHSSL